MMSIGIVIQYLYRFLCKIRLLEIDEKNREKFKVLFNKTIVFMCLCVSCIAISRLFV